MQPAVGARQDGHHVRRRRRRPTTIPEPGTEAFRVWTLWLGHRLAELGTGPVELHLQRFGAVARHLGVDPASTDVVTDRSRTDLDRSRAFYRVATVLDDLDAVLCDPEEGA